MTGEEQLHERMAYCDERSAELHEMGDSMLMQGDQERAREIHNEASHWSERADAIEGELAYGSDCTQFYGL